MDLSTGPPPNFESAVPIAYAANPTPPTQALLHSHPPYAEMIRAAITALKERNGSSRSAIAKYIDKEYSNLPPTHSALLTHHLKRLKNIGQLFMVKHSYKLSNVSNGNDNGFSSAGPKRRPGRPPKPTKPNANPEAQTNAGVLGSEVVDALPTMEPSNTIGNAFLSAGPQRGWGHPPKPKPKPKPNANLETQTNVGVVGPEFVDAVLTMEAEMESVGGDMLKRGRGRPARSKSSIVLLGQDGLKRRPGRPPRSGPVKRSVRRLKNVKIPFGDDAGGGVLLEKRRGRPPKTGGGAKRPRKNVGILGGHVGGGPGGGAALVPIGAGGGVLPGKRRGRPPKAGGVEKPRKLGGKPFFGKDGSTTALKGSGQKQLMAYQDLKSKLEYVQSRISQVVTVVKPHLNNKSAVTALMALQELEQLAKINLTASLNGQGALHASLHV